MTMQMLVEQFPEQLIEALEIFSGAQLRKSLVPFKNVHIIGLGGSGIGGTIVSELAFSFSEVPITVSKGYFIPAFVGSETLVVVSSYSGNTEETLACYEESRKRGAHIVCITSGGKVAELAREQGHDLLLIPGGHPPRACLGYSMVQLLGVCVFHGLLPETTLQDVTTAAAALRTHQPAIVAEATTLSNVLFKHTPVIYSTTQWEGVAIRLRQQINENSKMLCWHQVIPEMNHNELVGWAGGSNEQAVLLLRDPDEYERNDFRIELNKNTISKKTTHFFEVMAQGTSSVEKALWLIHLGDWLSLKLAELRGVDPIEIDVINFLKGELSKK